MGNRKISFAEGEYYHVYNRGVDKRNVFEDEADKRRFLKSLLLFNNSQSLAFRDFYNQSLKEIHIGLTLTQGKTYVKNNKLTAIGAFCLMPNHFHLLLKEISEGGVTSFIRKLTTSYTMYFNEKYERNGALFQGAFGARHIKTDEYLKYLWSYIHLNPVKIIQPDWKEVGIKNKQEVIEYLNNYSDSSYLDYLQKDRAERLILDKQEFPEYFQDTKDFQVFVDYWLNYKEE